MKRYKVLLCMIACILGLTACGNGETLTQYEQDKVEAAKQRAPIVVSVLSYFMDEQTEGAYDGLTMEEVAYEAQLLQYNIYGQVIFEAEGNGFSTAAESFRSAAADVGAIQSFGDVTAKIDGNQIVVNVEVKGEKKDAVAEVIFSNDRFLVLESAALNPKATVGELMTGAALNTLIGMGTVFVVLILISFIISCFRVIPAIQKKAADRKAGKSKDIQSTGVDNAVAQIATREETAGDDDLELAAVIAAAVAAYEGAGSADGYVVRSIRRHR